VRGASILVTIVVVTALASPARAFEEFTPT